MLVQCRPAVADIFQPASVIVEDALTSRDVTNAPYDALPNLALRQESQLVAIFASYTLRPICRMTLCLLICEGGFSKWSHYSVIYVVILLSDILGMVINMGSPLILNAFKCKHHRQNVIKIKKK